MCALVDKSIRVISFNAFRTLIKPKEHSAQVYARFAQQLGFDIDAKTFEDRFYPTFIEMRKKDPCYGFNKSGTFCWWNQLMQKSFGDIINDRRLVTKLTVNTFDFYATGDAWTLQNKNVSSDLDHLLSKNFQIGIISNSDFRLRNIFSELGLLPRVEFLALSGEVGLEKPNPAIFNTLLKRFRLKNREQILHIGNDIEADYNAAKKFGASACLIEDETDEFREAKNEEDVKEEKSEEKNFLIQGLNQLQVCI